MRWIRRKNRVPLSSCDRPSDVFFVKPFPGRLRHPSSSITSQKRETYEAGEIISSNTFCGIVDVHSTTLALVICAISYITLCIIYIIIFSYLTLSRALATFNPSADCSSIRIDMLASGTFLHIMMLISRTISGSTILENSEGAIIRLSSGRLIR